MTTFFHFFWIYVSLHLELLGCVNQEHSPMQAESTI